MGIIKEENLIFENLMKAQPDGGYITNVPVYENNIKELRKWMNSVLGERITKQINGNKRLDSFFFAWEIDDGFYMGTQYDIITRKFDTRKEKTISLSAKWVKIPVSMLDLMRGFAK